MDWAAEIARGPFAWGPRVTMAEMASVLVLWLGLAYGLIPAFWRRRLRGARLPGDLRTRTVEGLPGDPVNLFLAGSAAEVVDAFTAAGWSPCDPVTVRSALGIGLSVALARPYARAPVSALLLEGRRQDLAFERLDGRGAGRRHHLRLWRLPGEAPVWAGAASYDRGVGFSHRTGQLTHHIAPDLDAERSVVVADLSRAGWVQAVRTQPGVGAGTGRNGGGDPWRTDGTVRMVALRRPPAAPVRRADRGGARAPRPR